LAENKKKNKETKHLLKSDFLSGEGISDVEEKRLQSQKKRDIIPEITSEERDNICKQIEQILVFKIDYMDVLYFLLLQLLPLLLIGLSMLIPSIYFFTEVNTDIRNVLIILIIMGSLTLFYSVMRLFALISYKIEITNNNLRWRNYFKWITIEKQVCEKIIPIGSYYFFLPVIRGLIQYGYEVIKITTEEKIYWIRAYPFRKKKGKELIKSLLCWLELK
jgi:hypothetical protein